MKTERISPQCILGNGNCPETCKLYPQSAKITRELGDKFDPQLSRRAIFFRDAFDPKVTVARIAIIRDSCARERATTVTEVS